MLFSLNIATFYLTSENAIPRNEFNELKIIQI